MKIKTEKRRNKMPGINQINSDDEMFDAIKENINERMSHFTDSRHPTNDEVRIVWLVTEVTLLQADLKSCKSDLKSSRKLADALAMVFESFKDN